MEDFSVVFEFSNTPPPGSPHALAHRAPKASIYRHISEHVAQGTNLYLGCHYLLTCLRYAVVLDSLCSLLRGYYFRLARTTFFQVAVDQSSCHSTLHSLNFEDSVFNPLKPELNSICYLLALLGAHHFLHVSRIRVKLLTFRLLMSYIYIYDISHLRVKS